MASSASRTLQDQHALTAVGAHSAAAGQLICPPAILVNVCNHLFDLLLLGLEAQRPVGMFENSSLPSGQQSALLLLSQLALELRRREPHVGGIMVEKAYVLLNAQEHNVCSPHGHFELLGINGA